MCDSIRLPHPPKPLTRAPWIHRSSCLCAVPIPWPENRPFLRRGSTFAKFQIRALTSSLNDDSSSPSSSSVSVDLLHICREDQFDKVVSNTKHDPVVILWMASWCRKCIYLKPKLQKLAAEYYPRLKFYCIDVNKVPHKLVAVAGVTKMPSIQLWKDGEKQNEIIGGHKAHLVINEVRNMIEGENEM